MKTLGIVTRVFVDDDLVKCDAKAEGDIYRDMVLLAPLRVQPDLSVGDRVLIEPVAGADSDYLAQPYKLVTDTTNFELQVGDIRVRVTGSKVQIQDKDGTPVALATNADLKKLYDLLQGQLVGTAQWIVAPTDGGAALQTAAGLLSDPKGTTILEGE